MESASTRSPGASHGDGGVGGAEFERELDFKWNGRANIDILIGRLETDDRSSDVVVV